MKKTNIWQTPFFNNSKKQMKLPETVFVNSKLILNGELILQTIQPFYVARVFKFESPEAMENFAIKHNLILDAEHVSGYNILICYLGTKDNMNELVVLGHNVPKEAKPFLKQASEFYYEERIKGNESRQKKHVRR